MSNGDFKSWTILPSEITPEMDQAIVEAARAAGKHATDEEIEMALSEVRIAMLAFERHRIRQPGRLRAYLDDRDQAADHIDRAISSLRAQEDADDPVFAAVIRAMENATDRLRMDRRLFGHLIPDSGGQESDPTVVYLYKAVMPAYQIVAGKLPGTGDINSPFQKFARACLKVYGELLGEELIPLGKPAANKIIKEYRKFV